MRFGWIYLLLFVFSGIVTAAGESNQMNDELRELQVKTKILDAKIRHLENIQNHHHRMDKENIHKRHERHERHDNVHSRDDKKEHHYHDHNKAFHISPVQVQLPNAHPTDLEFYPSALIADHQVITYIAGTPVITSPYLGARPAFDGSDYIVNISSINRDIRLMEQRRNLYKGYREVGYVPPDVPVITLSGKVLPILTAGRNYYNQLTNNIDLGADELDVAAIVNESAEAYMAIAYNAAAPGVGAQRVAKSGLSLNMGFVNFGNLEKTPFYLTVGQVYIPFGRYATAMITPTMPAIISRTLARPLIFGYKSQTKTGPMLSGYVFTADTTLGSNTIAGVKGAYVFEVAKGSGQVGVNYISSMDNAYGMQYTSVAPNTTFGGFASFTNGSEKVKQIPAFDIHGNLSVGHCNVTAEWVTAIERFRTQDLSYNGAGALPRAGQVEGGFTFRSFDKPASISVGYQWSSQALALNIPQQRINAVYNISVWKDTLESLEYRHDFDYASSEYANGANSSLFPPNANSIGTGKGADTVLLQLGVFF